MSDNMQPIDETLDDESLDAVDAEAAEAYEEVEEFDPFEGMSDEELDALCDEDEMHELNHEWRGIDRTTDVLSFECDSAFDDDIPADETLELGDIILAPQVIARQAPGFGNSPADECRLMLVHGMLHLLGYDHIEDDEAEVMEAREDAILRDLSLERGEDPKLVHVGPITNHAHD